MRQINAPAVQQLCGVSRATLWRWLEDPNLAFPKPVKINTRRYWLEAEILTWLEAQRTTAPA
jgi:predicted DNA-binding transcriptional regulator AlpA